MNTFFQWLEKQKGKLSLSPKKEKYFHQLHTIWERSEKTALPSSSSTDIAWERLNDRIKKTELRSRPLDTKPKAVIWRKPKLAFAFLLLLLITGIIYYYSLPVTYKTDRTEYLTCVLPDSSEVKLNCSSQLTVDKKFNESFRSVYLKGEGYFKVRKGDLPFLVQTDIGLIKVVGTEFNVKLRDHLLELFVDKGVVEMRSGTGGKDSTVILHGGEYSECGLESFPLKPYKMNIEPYPGWLYNKLSCNNTKLIDVCDEVERRFDVSIQLADKTDEAITITGVFEADKVNTVLNAICILLEKEFKFKNGIYLIY